MSVLVPITLLGWVPAVLFLFAALPARRAVIAGFLLAWLFLPMAVYPIQGLPDYDKAFAACGGILLATLLFDPQRYLSFRPSWVDVPMLVWCLVPLASSLSSGLGLYDGLSTVLRHGVVWGAPYLIGRLYLRTPADLRALALALFVGGLLYVPLCLYEVRMSPLLHYKIYGYHQHVWVQTQRWGGWRPTVFMQHGLAVAMWMTTASLAGLWLWRTRRLPRWTLVPAGASVGLLLVTTILCKSAAALVLLAVGAATLWLGLRRRHATPLWVLLLLAPAYLGARTVGDWDGGALVSASRWIVGDRADSLQSRLDNEDRILANVYQRPVFGWGYAGWLVFETEHGAEGQATPDGLWVIAAGRNGAVGLLSLYAVFLVPAGLALRCVAARGAGLRLDETDVPLLAVLMALYAIDNCFNAMPNPVFMLMAGGLAAFGVSQPQPGAVRLGRRSVYHAARPVPSGVAVSFGPSRASRPSGP